MSGAIECRHGERRHREVVCAGFRSRDPHDPTAASTVAKEGAHRRREVRIDLLAALLVPDQRRILTEDGRKLRRIFQGDRRIQRAGRREADEDGHVHAWQRLRQLRRLHLEAKAGQAA